MFREPIDSMRVISFEEQASYLTETSQPLRDIAKIILETGMRRRSIPDARRESRFHTEDDFQSVRKDESSTPNHPNDG